MIDCLTSPVTFLLFFTLLFVALSRARLTFRRMAAICLFICWAMCTPAAANWMVLAVESQVDTPAGCEPGAASVAVVLTGGADRSPNSAKDIASLSKATLERLVFTAQWVKTHPVKKLVLSGGGPFQVAESLVSEYFVRLLLGDVSVATEIESASKTTWESALKIAATQTDRRHAIFLMTSRLHMPRAVMAFKANGFRVCPVPTDSLYINGGGIGYFYPQITAMKKFDSMLHELIGIAYYWLRYEKD